MANATMYSKKDKKPMKFPITCTHTKDDCEKCVLNKFCDKKAE